MNYRKISISIFIIVLFIVMNVKFVTITNENKELRKENQIKAEQIFELNEIIDDCINSLKD